MFKPIFNGWFIAELLENVSFNLQYTMCVIDTYETCLDICLSNPCENGATCAMMESAIIASAKKVIQEVLANQVRYILITVIHFFILIREIPTTLLRHYKEITCKRYPFYIADHTFLHFISNVTTPANDEVL